MAVEILEWAHEEARFVLEGRLLVAQPTDNNWRRGRTVKLAPVTAMLVTNGKVNVLEVLRNIERRCNAACSTNVIAIFFSAECRVSRI